ncbi:MAG: hypothetical protein AVDCRST_MAG49-3182, partial [uncultured Thermomicrobiales bacterium]
WRPVPARSARAAPPTASGCRRLVADTEFGRWALASAGARGRAYPGSSPEVTVAGTKPARAGRGPTRRSPGDTPDPACRPTP